jgi:signal transduction histidine kinase
MILSKHILLTGTLLALLISGPAQAGERGSRDEALAMTKKAVAFIKANGADKAYAEFTAKTPAFHDRDLYVIVYDGTGKCLAHGNTPALVGKDLSAASYVQERVKLMKTKTSFWQNYDFIDPISKKISPKSTYCEVLNATAVCVGIYKDAT